MAKRRRENMLRTRALHCTAKNNVVSLILCLLCCLPYILYTAAQCGIQIEYYAGRYNQKAKAWHRCRVGTHKKQKGGENLNNKIILLLIFFDLMGEAGGSLHTCTPLCTHAHRTHAHAHARTPHTHTRTHTRTRAHAHTHAHTHTSSSSSLSLGRDDLISTLIRCGRHNGIDNW